MTVRGNFGHAVKANGWRYWGGLTTATIRYYIRQRRPVALSRALRHTIGSGYYGELCQVCGRPYVLWAAPDDLYLRVVGKSSGLFCPNCFDRAAEPLGIELQWVPRIFTRAGSPVGGDLVQPDVNQRQPDSSQPAGTSIGDDQPDVAAETQLEAAVRRMREAVAKANEEIRLRALAEIEIERLKLNKHGNEGPDGVGIGCRWFCTCSRFVPEGQQR